MRLFEIEEPEFPLDAPEKLSKAMGVTLHYLNVMLGGPGLGEWDDANKWASRLGDEIRRLREKPEAVSGDGLRAALMKITLMDIRNYLDDIEGAIRPHGAVFDESERTTIEAAFREIRAKLGA